MARGGLLISFRRSLARYWLRLRSPDPGSELSDNTQEGCNNVPSPGHRCVTSDPGSYSVLYG